MSALKHKTKPAKVHGDHPVTGLPAEEATLRKMKELGLYNILSMIPLVLKKLPGFMKK